MPPEPTLTWQKSSYSSEASSCIYLATAPDSTLRLRESDEPDVVLHTGPATLTALIAAVKRAG
ncbi:DUF397 domain-containing protein [Streptomyces phyllanthi]|uniref:DUF397 domain-containing protein n=1 Tax=Streptomyces phyllanthi TaxID=1803180 RepID=A0A5N8W519_9ACTN|nr:DUF397 domain-containing protein [Streptomyces phyllanthi]MPY42580.1 DUF397 domain-containing protein [Streptomyces phyllanthi]